MRIVALLARPPGLEVLKAILSKPQVDLVQVYTPLLLPKAEGGTERPEASQFLSLCKEYDTPCQATRTLDMPKINPCDLMIVCNWREMLCKEQLEQATHPVNIHRGDLPKYKGARPVRQAVQAGDRIICVTAHTMTIHLDDGPPIAKVFHPRKTLGLQGLIDSGSTSALDQVEAIEREALMPLYAPLTRMILEYYGAGPKTLTDWDGLGPGGA